jgi:hypothetical protein
LTGDTFEARRARRARWPVEGGTRIDTHRSGALAAAKRVVAEAFRHAQVELAIVAHGPAVRGAAIDRCAHGVGVRAGVGAMRGRIDEIERNVGPVVGW